MSIGFRRPRARALVRKAGTTNLCKNAIITESALPSAPVARSTTKQISRINLEKLDLHQSLITVFTYNRF